MENQPLGPAPSPGVRVAKPAQGAPDVNTLLVMMGQFRQATQALTPEITKVTIAAYEAAPALTMLSGSMSLFTAQALTATAALLPMNEAITQTHTAAVGLDTTLRGMEGMALVSGALMTLDMDAIIMQETLDNFLAPALVNATTGFANAGSGAQAFAVVASTILTRVGRAARVALSELARVVNLAPSMMVPAMPGMPGMPGVPGAPGAPGVGTGPGGPTAARGHTIEIHMPSRAKSDFDIHRDAVGYAEGLGAIAQAGAQLIFGWRGVVGGRGKGPAGSAPTPAPAPAPPRPTRPERRRRGGRVGRELSKEGANPLDVFRRTYGEVTEFFQDEVQARADALTEVITGGATLGTMAVGYTASTLYDYNENRKIEASGADVVRVEYRDPGGTNMFGTSGAPRMFGNPASPGIFGTPGSPGPFGTPATPGYVVPRPNPVVAPSAAGAEDWRRELGGEIALPAPIHPAAPARVTPNGNAARLRSERLRQRELTTQYRAEDQHGEVKKETEDAVIGFAQSLQDAIRSGEVTGPVAAGFRDILTRMEQSLPVLQPPPLMTPPEPEPPAIPLEWFPPPPPPPAVPGPSPLMRMVQGAIGSARTFLTGDPDDPEDKGFVGAAGEMAGAKLGPLLGALGPLGMVATVLEGVFQGLAPLIDAVKEPLRIVGEIFGKALAPILKAIFPVFKLLAIAATWVGQIFFTIAGAILTAIGSLVRGIGNLVNKLPGSPGDPLVRAGQSMIDMGRGFAEGARALEEGREEIRNLEFGETADTVAEANEQLRNVPEGFKVALARFTASSPVPASGGGPVPATIPAAPPPPTVVENSPVTIHTVQIVSNDPEQIWRELQPVMERENYRHSGTLVAA